MDIKECSNAAAYIGPQSGYKCDAAFILWLEMGYGRFQADQACTDDGNVASWHRSIPGVRDRRGLSEWEHVLRQRQESWKRSLYSFFLTRWLESAVVARLTQCANTSTAKKDGLKDKALEPASRAICCFDCSARTQTILPLQLRKCIGAIYKKNNATKLGTGMEERRKNKARTNATTIDEQRNDNLNFAAAKWRKEDEYIAPDE
ncbi:hypothetical protein EDD85DRAFT_977147 [Armillaria nabsnona]|nr:hypothetical protein EDD85DRAFT_977147 [Armillaria nabsnona]